MHLKMLLALTVVSASASASTTEQSVVPTSPCPGVFRYVRKDDATHYGEINVPASTSTLHVKMFTTDTIRSRMKRPELQSFGGNEDNNKTALFRVDFPTQRPLPKVDQISVDTKVVCSGNKDSSTKITSTFELTQSNYRSSSDNRIENGRNRQSSYSRSHSYSYNTNT